VVRLESEENLVSWVHLVDQEKTVFQVRQAASVSKEEQEQQVSRGLMEIQVNLVCLVHLVNQVLLDQKELRERLDQRDVSAQLDNLDLLERLVNVDYLAFLVIRDRLVFGDPEVPRVKEEWKANVAQKVHQDLLVFLVHLVLLDLLVNLVHLVAMANLVHLVSLVEQEIKVPKEVPAGKEELVLQAFLAHLVQLVPSVLLEKEVSEEKWDHKVWKVLKALAVNLVLLALKVRKETLAVLDRKVPRVTVVSWVFKACQEGLDQLERRAFPVHLVLLDHLVNLVKKDLLAEMAALVHKVLWDLLDNEEVVVKKVDQVPLVLLVLPVLLAHLENQWATTPLPWLLYLDKVRLKDLILFKVTTRLLCLLESWVEKYLKMSGESSL